MKMLHHLQKNLKEVLLLEGNFISNANKSLLFNMVRATDVATISDYKHPEFNVTLANNKYLSDFRSSSVFSPYFLLTEQPHRDLS